MRHNYHKEKDNYIWVHEYKTKFRKDLDRIRKDSASIIWITWSIIERYEINGEVHKDDQSKMETLKDMISHMIKQEDRRNEA